MRHVFLDTSGLIALIHSDDQFHSTAETIWRHLVTDGTALVVTDLVLIELGDGLSRLRHRRAAIILRDRLLQMQSVELVEITRENQQRAWDLFDQRPDKEWGMTDCISIIVMQDHGIAEVFSLDRHFQQAGFQLLLRDAEPD